MPGPRGVRYHGAGDVSGYGQAAIANVRALVNANVPTQWIPFDWAADRPRSGRWTLPDGRVRVLLTQCGKYGCLADVPALAEATSAVIACDTVVAHAPPEFWPDAFETGRRNIGCVAWESDRAPAHWLPLLRRADAVVVPSVFVQDAFRRRDLRAPLHVVPHIRRHAWCYFSPDEIAAARADLGIPPGHRVFYTIGSWDPRKALPELVRAFVRAFEADDPVALLIKTGVSGHGTGPLYPQQPTTALATAALGAAAAEKGRLPPMVLLHNQPLDGDEVDLIHALGDVYISLSRGEGWALGAFEAATLGKPVVMTGWGGQLDYLGDDWPGAVAYRLVPALLLPPQQPSFFPSQRWAEADPDAAVALLRGTFADPAPALAAAARIRERIVRDYAEPVVVRRWLELLGG